MRYIIAAATAFALVVGIAIGFTLTARVFEAEAKPPPPGPQAVEEQNLDGSGFIAVHEQGTADVNVTNAALPVSGTVDVGNLPVVQDVNVISLPSQDPGPLEFTHFIVRISPNGDVRDPSTGEPFDKDATLIGLSAQGWELVRLDIVPFPSADTNVIYTLSRPAP